jgi:starvation-inducible DNA-binding protein
MDLQTALEQTFAGNFVVYYRAHQAHVNVRGRDFYQYHKLLKSVYTTLQDHIDDLGEKLQTIGAQMPACLHDTILTSLIPDEHVAGSAEDLLHAVLDGIEVLIDQYRELNEVAEATGSIDIANMAQDLTGELTKMRWQLEATLDE